MSTVKKNSMGLAIVLMLISALSTCTGQLMWKLSSINGLVWYYIAGFLLYGIGAILMILAFRLGEMSILHPMLSVGFMLSIVLGAVVLDEPITLNKVVGIVFIIIGMFFLGRLGLKEKTE